MTRQDASGRLKTPHKPLRLLLVAAALTFSLAPVGQAQAGLQAASSSAGRSGSAGMTGGNHPVGGVAGGGGLTAVPEDVVKLRLAPGFLLNLNVLDDADFAGTYRVDQQGEIAVPVLGALHVAGETVSEARAQIRQTLLSSQILRDPQVTLTVVEYTAPEITVMGEVASPGKYPLLAPRKLVDVLALAGGTTTAAGNRVEITGGAAGRAPLLIHYSRASDPGAVAGIMVGPGDTVNVERAGIVYVLGAVLRPGGYIMQEEGTLNALQAVAMAYGPTPLASTSTIYLIRRNADGSVQYTAVPYKKMTHGQSGEVQLRAKDILYVPTSTLKSIYADTQSIMNSAAVAGIYVGLGQ